MHRLTNLLFSGIPLLYYYINFNSSIICCISCKDIYIYLSFGITLFASFDCNSLSCSFYIGFFEILVLLSTILLLTRSPVASAVF